MELPLLSRIRLAWLAGRLPPARLAGRLPDAAEPGLWTIAVGAATLLTWWLTASLLIVSTVLMVIAWVAGRRRVALLNGFRLVLAEAQQQRAAMEQALRQSQKMEAMGRLTAGVAHDFNNHLTVISSNVELLTSRLRADQDRLLRHTDAAMQGVRRAAILTGRLLSFARQPAAEPEPVEVDRLVHDLSGLLQRTLGDRIRLEVRLSDAPWFTWVDANQMENALLSVVVNARDQVPYGGVLRIVVSNVQVDAVFSAAHPAVPPGDYIEVAVHGPAEAKRWAPANDLTSADLFMARAFVREAGGCLLRSDPDPGGLSLRLFLPRYLPPSEASPGPVRSAAGQLRILVVEDDAPIRAVCVETLRGQGYEVLEAPDAMEAFRLIADFGGIDLLFTDLGLPGGVSGRALADAARNVDPAMRVLFTTGYPDMDIAERPGSALLRKPFNPAQLVAKVQALLDCNTAGVPSETVQG